MGYLHQLAALVSPQDDDLRDSIRRVSEFAQQVRDSGLSHVLEVIFDQSVGEWDSASAMHDLVDAITGSFGGRVVFGNLNYDTLLLAALLYSCKDELADLGHGWKSVSISQGNGKKRFPSLRTNSTDWPDDRRVRLLHLHGSLTYWTDAGHSVYAKLDVEYLRSNNQWEAIRENSTDLRPVIVLANQKDKTAHVTEFPFSLAYELFDIGLDDAQHWLIIGYSFKDEPVNAMLRHEFAERSDKPKVLVVTYGDDPSQKDVERAFGWRVEDGPSNEWLRINRDGADGIESTSDWQDFTAKTAPGAAGGGAA